MKKATLLLTLFAVSCMGMAQGYVVLTDLTRIDGIVVNNYPTRLLFQTDDGFALITKERIADFQLRDSNYMVYDLDALATYVPITKEESAGRLLSLGANTLVTGIGIGLTAAIASGFLSMTTSDGSLTTKEINQRNNLSQGLAIGGAAISLVFTIGGYSSISRAGKMLDAKIY